MNKINSPQIRTEQDRNFANAISPRSPLPSVLMVVGGLVLVLGAPTLVWLFRGMLADLGPRAFIPLWNGGGGLLLLYFAAGLPLGAILLSAGGARLYPASERAERVLLPLLGIQLIYFTYHAIRDTLDLGVPYLFFGLLGFSFLIMFLALVWNWARKRPSLEPERQRAVDLQLGAGLCFFTAAWQACGFAAKPGFALYPELVQKLASQSFVAGQAFAVQVFLALGFIFLLLAMRAEWTRKPTVGEQGDKHDEATKAI